MSIFARALVVLVAIVALLGLLGIFLPSGAHVERSATIEASPATVFALVNGFRSFNKWSPWFERDPEARYELTGPDFGVGAKLTWFSENPQVGSGYQEIVASEPYSGVRCHLDFGSQGTAETFYRIEPIDGSTLLTWGFDSEFGMNLISRYFGLMFDKWIGADYDAGLANLAALAAELPKADWTDLEIAAVAVEPTTIAYLSSSSGWGHEAIGQAWADANGAVMAFMTKHELEQGGPPVAITTSYDDEVWRFDAGVPVAGSAEIEIDVDSAVQIRETYGGKAVRGIHLGSYADLSASWDKVAAYAAAHGFEVIGSTWEAYVSDPASTPEAELTTYLFMPVQ